MDNQFEKSISFKKHTGKETVVRVVSETLINKGNYGKIFDTVIEIGGKRKRFIVKKYFDPETSEIDPPSDNLDGSINAQSALKKYSFAKKAGLKVFPTFRIGEDKKSILMTTELSEDQICVSSNNKRNQQDQDKENQDEEKKFMIDRIEDEDLNKFLENIFAEGLKAGEKGLQIYRDLPFFIVSKSNPTKIDFILGDFDMLRRFEHPFFTGIFNINEIEMSLKRFSQKNIAISFEKIFLQKVEFYHKQAFDTARKGALK